MKNLTLYHYWRSSSSWRVRLALAHKGLAAKHVAINLLDGSNESAEHLARNPLGYVPVLEVDGRLLIESMAIFEFLDELQPAPLLFPGDAYDRAHVRALCEIVNSSTQPLQNPDVAEFARADGEERKRWCQHWIRRGLRAFQRLAAPRSGRFSFGDVVSAADFFLVPQCYAAERFGVSLDEFPLVKAWNSAVLATAVGQATHPDKFKP